MLVRKLRFHWRRPPRVPCRIALWGVWVQCNCMQGRVPGVLLTTPKPAAFLNFFKTVNTLFEIEIENVMQKTTHSPTFLLDPLVTAKTPSFLAPRSFAISPLELYATAVTQLKKIRDSLQTKKTYVCFFLCIFCTSHMEISSFISYGSLFTL